MKRLNADIREKKEIISPSAMEKMASQMEQNNERRQKEVDEYNGEKIFCFEEDMGNKKWVDHRILIRLFKRDYLTPMGDSVISSKVHKKSWVSIETPSGIQQELIEDPLPYKHVGVICAIREGENNSELPFNVGSVVEISNEFDPQSGIYYPNKGDIDSPISSEDLRNGVNPYPNHTGYFKVEPYLVEAVL